MDKYNNRYSYLIHHKKILYFYNQLISKYYIEACHFLYYNISHTFYENIK